MTSYELKIYSLIPNIKVDLFCPSNKEQFQISVKPFKTNKKYINNLSWFLPNQIQVSTLKLSFLLWLVLVKAKDKELN